MQSTISGNSATRTGGVNAQSAIHVYGSTIAFNTETAAFGAGLRVLGEALLQSTIVAGNLSAGTPGDIGGSSGSTLSGANDLIGLSTLTVPAGTLGGDPLLAPLADNGGTNRTHALQPGSPAIDHGNLVNNLFTDQRGLGYARVGGGVADIGAYEVQSTGVTSVVANCADDGAGSLRDVVAAASSGDTIDLRSVGCGTIALASALPVAVGTLGFIGPGAALLTIDGGAHDRVIAHSGYGTLAIIGMTIAHGRVASETTTASGGCIYSRGGVRLESVTVTGCAADSPMGAMGGGAWVSGPAQVHASVVSGNTVTSASSMVYGGGLMSYGLDMRDSTLSGNTALSTATSGSSYSRAGGALLAGRVAIIGSTVSDNFATRDGGLFLRGNTTLVNSTLSGNTALADAAGLYAFGFLDVWNSTVAANTISANGASFGAGISAAHVVHLESSIVHGNTVSGTPYDITFGAGIVVVGTHNLIGFSFESLPPDTSNADPLLGPLQDNGGPTLTHALLAGSPATDAGINPLDLVFDQRGVGFARAVGAAADIGATEFTPVTDTIFANGFEGCRAFGPTARPEHRPRRATGSAHHRLPQ